MVPNNMLDNHSSYLTTYEITTQVKFLMWPRYNHETKRRVAKVLQKARYDGVCFIAMPWPHSEFNLSGYLTCCYVPQRLNSFGVYKSGGVLGRVVGALGSEAGFAGSMVN